MFKGISKDHSYSRQKLPKVATAILSGPWQTGTVNEVSTQVSIIVRKREEVGLVWERHGVDGRETQCRWKRDPTETGERHSVDRREITV